MDRPESPNLDVAELMDHESLPLAEAVRLKDQIESAGFTVRDYLFAEAEHPYGVPRVAEILRKAKSLVVLCGGVDAAVQAVEACREREGG